MIALETPETRLSYIKMVKLCSEVIWVILVRVELTTTSFRF